MARELQLARPPQIRRLPFALNTNKLGQMRFRNIASSTHQKYPCGTTNITSASRQFSNAQTANDAHQRRIVRLSDSALGVIRIILIQLITKRPPGDLRQSGFSSLCETLAAKIVPARNQSPLHLRGNALRSGHSPHVRRSTSKQRLLCPWSLPKCQMPPPQPRLWIRAPTRQPCQRSVIRVPV